MKIFAGPRGSGRTTALLRWAQEGQGRVIVVRDGLRQDHALDCLERIGGPMVRIYRAHEFQQTGFGTGIDVGVDDLEDVIKFHRLDPPSGMTLAAVTLESDDLINIPTPPWMIQVDEVVQGMSEMLAELS